MKPVSKTAFYCCGVRMQDALSTNSLLNDQYAKRLMGTDGLKYWETFKYFKYANISNVARHYIIDQSVKKALKSHPNMSIFLIGAGLDSRAYRIKGGQWFEVDESAIIEYKNQILPIEESQNKLVRIPIDFTQERLIDKLMPYQSNEFTLIIVEGVWLYLSREQKEALIQALKACFQHHSILCDLMKKYFFEMAARSIHQQIISTGTTFQDMSNFPNRIFLSNGYKQKSMIPTSKVASEKNILPAPKFLVNLLLKNFLKGYAIYEFNYVSKD